MTSALIPQDKASLVSNILAIVGFVIVIAIVIWGVLYLTGLSKPIFSSFFRPLGSTLKVTVPSSPVPVNEPVTVSWRYSPKTSGTYAFLYQCRPGLQFRTKNADNSLSTIPCGAAFSIPGNTNSFSIIPTASTVPTSTVPISIVYVPAATSSPSVTGSATLALKAATSATEPPPQTPPTTAPPATSAKPPAVKPQSGRPDLSVKILAIGVLDPITGDLIPRRPTSPNDLAAVRFDIANEGTASTGEWYFTAQLPTAPPQTYSSPTQISLAPGDHIENMLRFKPVLPEGGTFSVYADHLNLIREGNEVNNYVNENL